jgi:hypothetical protein
MPNPPIQKNPANPAFKEFAAAVREAAQSLKKAGDTAATQLCFPQMDFRRVRRHLESIAVWVENENLLRAYVKHNTLTDAPPHPRNLSRVRPGRKTSERKKRAAIENGRKGGRSDRGLKAESARENGKLGGRPPNKSRTIVRGHVASVPEAIPGKHAGDSPLSSTPMELPFGG